jgi:hypothetical protein
LIQHSGTIGDGGGKYRRTDYESKEEASAVYMKALDSRLKTAWKAEGGAKAK